MQISDCITTLPSVTVNKLDREQRTVLAKRTASSRHLDDRPADSSEPPVSILCYSVRSELNLTEMHSRIMRVQAQLGHIKDPVEYTFIASAPRAIMLKKLRKCMIFLTIQNASSSLIFFGNIVLLIIYGHLTLFGFNTLEINRTHKIIFIKCIL